jgi:hypothetical protein
MTTCRLTGVWNWTAMVATPETIAFPVLVAVTVTLPVVAGAVKSPLVLMAPRLAVQVMAEL